MIKFYIERQPDDLLKASFFDEDRLIGHTMNITIDQIDSAVHDIFPDVEKVQIFELPGELS